MDRAGPCVTLDLDSLSVEALFWGLLMTCRERFCLTLPVEEDLSEDSSLSNASSDPGSLRRGVG